MAPSDPPPSDPGPPSDQGPPDGAPDWVPDALPPEWDRPSPGGPGLDQRAPGAPDLDDVRSLGFRPGGRARAALSGPRGPARPGGMLPDRRRWRMFALLAVVLVFAGVALGRHPRSCLTHPPSGPNPADASFWVASAVAGVPCQDTGRSVYDLRDSARQAMAGLDPVADPSGGYLGVYTPAPTSASGGPAPGSQVLLGRSSNLSTWRRVRVLAAPDAGSPTLQPVPGGGYLLAFQSRRIIELRFYPTLPALLAASQAASIDLPLRLSGSRNGAPSFQSVAWNGGLRHSRLTITFDYLSGGLDREGIGVIRGFRNWSARPDSTADQQLDQRGLTGNHGQQRQFTVSGRSWRILEAQDLTAAKAGTQAGWHIALDDPIRNEIFPLKLGTENGTLSSSFGRPAARVLPAPTEGGQALVVSMYVFGVGPAASERGELLYWTPIGAS